MQNPNVLATARDRMRSAIRQYRQYGKGVMEMMKEKSLHHHMLAELLYEFAYQDGNEDPARVIFLYTQGQESMPVPLYCLTPPLKVSHPVYNERPLRVGLLSMRHLSLDHIVDVNWLVNRELPQDEVYLRKDKHCYELTQQQLRLLAAKKQVRRIHLYQTGYHAAVIGFYRALIEYLRDVRAGKLPELEVTPYYFDSNRRCYWEGQTWR